MTFEESWLNVKKVLLETFKLNDAQIMWLSNVRGELSRLAAGGMQTNPFFTLHNEVHSDNVVLLLGKLVNLFNPQFSLSDYEAYLLVASAYLHDVGMFFDPSRFKQVIWPNLAESLNFCPENLCDSGVRYQDALIGKPLDFQIRAVHHLLSAYVIEKDGSTLFGLRRQDSFHILTICRGHRKADLCCRGCMCYKTDQTKLKKVRRDLLAALLRLADALDFFPDRAPDGAFLSHVWVFLENPVALKHWLNHYFAKNAHPTKNDREGNLYLDCQISYAVPARKRLNDQSYKDFFSPLFDGFVAEARCTDFDGQRYPPILLEALGIRDIHVDYSVSEEATSGALPDRIIEEMEQSGCTDILQFLHYLEADGPLKPTQYLMDRSPEVRTFKDMLAGDDPQHRLMFMVGDHGQGKTLLMDIFEQIAVERQVSCVRIDLSDTNEFNDILDAIRDKLGPSHFRLYSARRGKGVEPDRQMSEGRQQNLTGCFFRDWQAINEPPSLVLLLDTYERAAPMLQSWIEETFLDGLKHIEHVVAVIGGRKWPETDSYWQKHGYCFPLEGVRLDDYKDYAEQRGAPISPEDIVQLHRRMEGLPMLFANYVDSVLQAGV